MLTYDLLLGGMLLLAGLFQIGGKGKNRKRELTFLLIVFVILGVTSAIRYSTGIDYSYTYAPGYEQVLQIRTFHCLDITMSRDICCCKRLLRFSAAIIR